MAGDNLLIIVIGGLAGLAGGFGKDYLSLRIKTDAAVRSKREEHYPTLWLLTQFASRYPPSELSRGDLHEAATALRCWYYGKGGAYLSRTSHTAYTNLQKEAARIANSGSDQGSKPIRNSDYQAMGDACSTLRTALTDDLLSRNRYPWSMLMAGLEAKRAQKWVQRNIQEIRKRSASDR